MSILRLELLVLLLELLDTGTQLRTHRMLQRLRPRLRPRFERLHPRQQAPFSVAKVRFQPVARLAHLIQTYQSVTNRQLNRHARAD